MQMLHCPNCGKPSGFKRALGFGTFFMVVLTCGLWLLLIPFYPARCINCGLTRGSAILHNFSVWFRGLSRGSKASVLLAPLAFLVVLAFINAIRPTRPMPEPTPSITTVATANQEPVQTLQTAQTEMPSEDHELHLEPNIFGRGAISDGRTYSVALISMQKAAIPPATSLFVQGTILGRFDTNVIVLADEEDPEEKILCSMSSDESEDVAFYYKIGETVRATGNFGMTNLGLPTLRDCQVSSATGKVVRPKPVDEPETPVNTDSNTRPASDGTVAPLPKENQVSIGQTQDEVTALLGPPNSVTTGAKHVYTYAHLTVVFVDGRVSELHETQ